jgi:hypothetical protein
MNATGYPRKQLLNTTENGLTTSWGLILPLRQKEFLCVLEITHNRISFWVWQMLSQAGWMPQTQDSFSDSNTLQEGVGTSRH